MRLLVLAGLFSALLAPMAMAAETTAACDIDETQRSLQQRIEPPAAGAEAREARPGASGGSQRSDAAVPTVARTETARRRGVTRRIPDAELIGGRGAL